MNKKVNLLRSFPEIREKDELFSIYRGFINCLNNQEAFVLLIDEKTTGLKAEAITKKIIQSVSNNPNKQSSQLIKESAALIKDLKWPRSQRLAKVLFGISSYIGEGERSKLIRYFLSSRYSSFRYYGYNIIERDNLKLNFKKELQNAWHEHHDIEILELLIDILNSEELFSIYKDNEEMFADSEFDFEVLKLRNRFYSKVLDFIPNRLSELLAKEPISYVFVMKYARRQIKRDLALEIYKKSNKSGSIAACYGELGQWDVLEEIFNNLMKKTKRSTQKKS